MRFFLTGPRFQLDTYKRYLHLGRRAFVILELQLHHATPLNKQAKFFFSGPILLLPVLVKLVKGQPLPKSLWHFPHVNDCGIVPI